MRKRPKPKSKAKEKVAADYSAEAKKEYEDNFNVSEPLRLLKKGGSSIALTNRWYLKAFKKLSGKKAKKLCQLYDSAGLTKSQVETK